MEERAQLILDQSLRGWVPCQCLRDNLPPCGDCEDGFLWNGPAVTSRMAKSDILTPWKLEDRMEREILTSTGVADPAVRRGMFHRAWNPARPDLNSRDGHYPVPRVKSSLDFSSGDGDDSGGSDGGD
jgi:hypothetical protein